MTPTEAVAVRLLLRLRASTALMLALAALFPLGAVEALLGVAGVPGTLIPPMACSGVPTPLLFL